MFCRKSGENDLACATEAERPRETPDTALNVRDGELDARFPRRRRRRTRRRSLPAATNAHHILSQVSAERALQQPRHLQRQRHTRPNRPCTRPRNRPGPHKRRACAGYTRAHSEYSRHDRPEASPEWHASRRVSAPISSPQVECSLISLLRLQIPSSCFPRSLRMPGTTPKAPKVIPSPGRRPPSPSSPHLQFSRPQS